MTFQSVQRRVLSVAALLFSLAVVTACTWSSLDFTITSQLRTRTSRSVRADDSDAAHEHGVPSQSSASTRIAASNADSAGSAANGAAAPPAIVGSLPIPFEGRAVLLPLFSRVRFVSGFKGFAQVVRGPPFLS
jgi:hypothetical protein